MLRTITFGLALFAGLVALGCDSSGSDDGLPSFYLEARIEGTDSSVTVGTNVAGGASADRQRRSQEVRWLNLDRDHLRVEIETFEPKDNAGLNIVSADGEHQYVCFSSNSTYSKTQLFDIPDSETLRVRPWSFGAIIGPWYGDAKTLDEFMEQLRAMSGGSADVRAAGEGTILGMETKIVEVSPVSSSSSSDGGETHHGVARYWVSLDRMVILKQEVIDEPVQSYVVEVTKLEWAPKNRGSVEFKPPPGASLEQPNSGSSSGAITPSATPSR